MPKMLNSGEILSVFKVTPRTLHRWIKGTDFPKPIKTGRSRRWFAADVDAYLSRKQKGGK